MLSSFSSIEFSKLLQVLSFLGEESKLKNKLSKRGVLKDLVYVGQGALWSPVTLHLICIIMENAVL